MDLKSLDRRERRKTVIAWMFMILFTVFFVIFWLGEESESESLDYVEQCIDVLENKSQHTVTQVEECRELIIKILRSEGIFGRIHT